MASFLDSPRIEVHAHRGARGYMPENTLPAFIKAVDFGADCLEMDVVISKDNQVVVSHEPWMNAAFCLQPNGRPIGDEEDRQHNLFAMTYQQIKKYDCGTKTHPSFPQQKSIQCYKPLLREVIQTIEEYAGRHKIKYNIEIKSEVGWDAIFQPAPAIFVQLVLAELHFLEVTEQVLLQSFDTRILQEIKKQSPSQIVSYLVENKMSLTENLTQLGFIPEIYAPEFVLITKELVQQLQQKGIQLITWTVNEEQDIEQLVASQKVSAIISDYPDKVRNILNRKDRN